MNDVLVTMAISIILQVIKQSVKNPQSKADLKRALLKVRNAINDLYADDSDFE